MDERSGEVRVPWALLVAVTATAGMIGLVAVWNLTGPPVRYEWASTPTPAAATGEPTVFVPLADCDRYGCVPVVTLSTPTPGR